MNKKDDMRIAEEEPEEAMCTRTTERERVVFTPVGLNCSVPAPGAECSCCDADAN